MLVFNFLEGFFHVLELSLVITCIILNVGVRWIHQNILIPVSWCLVLLLLLLNPFGIGWLVQLESLRFVAIFQEAHLAVVFVKAELGCQLLS